VGALASVNGSVAKLAEEEAVTEATTDAEELRGTLVFVLALPIEAGTP
jgi:hypothetical protein